MSKPGSQICFGIKPRRTKRNIRLRGRLATGFKNGLKQLTRFKDWYNELGPEVEKLTLEWKKLE